MYDPTEMIDHGIPGIWGGNECDHPGYTQYQDQANQQDFVKPISRQRMELTPQVQPGFLK